jgi:hypothetical protein
MLPAAMPACICPTFMAGLQSPFLFMHMETALARGNPQSAALKLTPCFFPRWQLCQSCLLYLSWRHVDVDRELLSSDASDYRE